jgi:hypothetical protein
MTEYMARRRCDEMARLPRREFEKKWRDTHEFEDPFFALLTPILLDSYSSTR